jgi:hypothetical protein
MDLLQRSSASRRVNPGGKDRHGLELGSTMVSATWHIGEVANSISFFRASTQQRSSYSEQPSSPTALRSLANSLQGLLPDQTMFRTSPKNPPPAAPNCFIGT